MKNQIAEDFGGKLRVRVSGILIQDGKLLMVKHRGLTPKGYLWAPPGGGLNFRESCHHRLKLEFEEETSLNIEVNRLLFVNEHLDPPLHALELFFQVETIKGRLKKGIDPELPANKQMIEEVRFFGKQEFAEENGPQMHAVFRNVKDPEEVLNMGGYFQNWK